MRNKYFTLIFILWVVLWAFLTARSLFAKGALNQYKILLSRSAEGKRSYVTGDNFYKFLKFCNDNMPKSASYRLIGVDKESIERRRTAYYLYPHLENANADFILVYNDPKTKAAAIEGYELFVSLNGDEYVMKKKGLK